MAYQTVNPVNNQLIKTYPAYNDTDVGAALQQADVLCHSAWAKDDIEPWLVVLYKLADLIDSRAGELAKIASQETGKLIKQSRGEVELCMQIARYYTGNTESLLTPMKYPSELGSAWVEYHSIGVLTATEPWNFPYYQLMRVLAPNLAAGNLIITKHASIVPHCVKTFAHLVRGVGAPEGAWANLFISQEQVAKTIVDDRVQDVALTGLEKTGSVVAAQAAKYIKKSTLELGDNGVFVVPNDTDLERAMKTGVQARLNSAGQVCTAAERFILHEDIAESFLAKFSEVFRQVKIGGPLDESTALGPLSSKDALDTLSKQIDEAVKSGATPHLDGKVAVREGNFFEPAVLTGVTRNNPAYFEEFSGPAAQICVVKNSEEAIQLANDSHHGLDGAVFDQGIERAKRMVSAIETGMVYINWFTDIAPEPPFGDAECFGYGRELSDLSIKELVNRKLVMVRR